jgi:PAS domain S-box-containing protein
MKKKDGSLIWCGIAGQAINAQNLAEGSIWELHDITSHRQSEESLRRMNRELQAISACNQTLIRAEDEKALLSETCRIICDKAGYLMAWVGYAQRDESKTVIPVAWAGSENGYLAKANITWDETVFGLGPTGTAIRSGATVYTQEFMTDPRFAPWRENALQRGYRSSIALPLKDENARVFGALTIYSGKPNAFTAEEIRLLEELSGDLAFGVGVLRTRVERKHAEEALKESKDYLNQILNSITDPIFVKDREHRFVLVNDAFCAFDGRRREALLGDNTFRFLPEEMGRSLRMQDESLFDRGGEYTTEDDFTDSNGNAHTFLTKKSLLTDKNDNKQIVGVLRDITEYTRLQAQFVQSQKMESVGLLAGGIAHDFNNLLNVINGYCELVLEDIAEDDPRRNDLELINQAGKRATSLTSQLLAFSRKQILQPEILDLNAAIVQMSLMLRRLISEDIELVSLAQPNLGHVNADPAQIQQILMNLAVNARDAMPKGGKLTIETANVDFDEDYVQEHPLTKAGAYVMLAVSDNGIGMDAATQSRLFEPFFTTKVKGKGTGLGLSTVYGIVSQSNGFIWVYSELGKGTTFKIYLPRVEGKIQATAESKLGLRLDGFETVLVVEDEESLRALTSRVLRGHGYSILEATNGKEALEIAKKHAGTIHLVITDVVMPEMGGKALVSHLKTTRPGIKSLFVSGYTDNAIVHHGILDSGVDFLQKPFTIESLSCKVREVLDS